MSIDRRAFLGLSLTGLVLPHAAFRKTPAPHVSFPLQDPVVVREMVGVSHNNPTRVRELVTAHPALARASIDWGHGDWESALGAASHVGNREIAEFLLANGARPTIFSAAMLGHVDVVRGFVGAMPGVQRVLGPHSLTLLSHARAGGDRAKLVLEYLQEAGGADNPPPTIALDANTRARYVGTYSFGPDVTDRLIVALNGENMTIQRPGFSANRLRAIAKDEFHPAGAEAVRIRFAGDSAQASSVDVLDPGVIVTATRITG